MSNKSQKRILYVAWVPYDRRANSFAQALGTEACLIHYFRIGQAIKYPFMAIKTMFILMQRRPKVILAMSPPLFCPFIIYLYCILFRAHFIIDAHTGSFDFPPWGTWLLPLNKFLCKKALVTIVTNEHLASVVQSWSGTALVMNPPILFPNYDFKSLEKKINLLLVNTFASDEPLEEVLEAAKGFPHVDFYITGDLSFASSTILENKPENVHFTGFVPYSEYVGLLKSVDGVLALTTRNNTLQSGGEEALFMGKPLITSRFPFLMKFFYKGTVYVESTVKGISQGIKDLLKNRKKMTSEMLQLREEHLENWNHCLDRLMKIVGQKSEISLTEEMQVKC